MSTSCFDVNEGPNLKERILKKYSKLFDGNLTDCILGFTAELAVDDSYNVCGMKSAQSLPCNCFETI